MTENDYKYDNSEIRTKMVLKIPIRNYKENKLLLARHPPSNKSWRQELQDFLEA
jgi:hypothetical protein